MNFIERALDWIINQIRKRRVIDPCAKCPGCGARKGSIRYLRSALFTVAMYAALSGLNFPAWFLMRGTFWRVTRKP